MDQFICHSGGCLGSDIAFELVAKDFGIKTIAYSFSNHSHKSENPKILTVPELNEGFEHVKTAAKTINRPTNNLSNYVKNLLSRNWFQIKNSEAIFAVGTFHNEKLVNGGTGWAVQMAIDNNKDVYVFDQLNNNWNRFFYELESFETINYIPELTKNFAGIGTREINDYGLNAILELFEENFKVDSL